MSEEENPGCWKKFKAFKKRARTVFNEVYPLGFLILAAWLFYQNKGLIYYPPDLSTQEMIKKALLTPTNRSIMVIGALYTLAGAFLFIIRLPFLDMEEYKFFGLEYKLKAEKQEAIANQTEEMAEKTLETHRKLESLRLSVLKYIHTPEIKLQMESYLIGDDIFKAQEALGLLGEIMENFYLDNLGINIETGYVEVTNGVLDKPNEFSQLPIGVQDVVKDAIATQETRLKMNKYSVAAIPLLWSDGNSFLVFYIRVDTDLMILNKSDCELAEIAWMVIKDSVYITWCEQELERVRG